MNDAGKSREELLLEVAGLRSQLAAAERDCQILVASLKDEHRMAEAAWLRRVEGLEAKLAGHSAGEYPALSGSQEETEAGECDSERQRLLAMVQDQTEELQAANEELTVQTEELRVQNEELLALNEILEEQKQALEHISRELETERALLKSVLEQMPASVVIAAAPNGPILLSNHRAEEIWRRRLGSRTDLEGFWRIPRYHPDGRVYRKEEMPLSRSLIEGDVVMDQEMILRPQGGPAIHLSVSSAPVRDEQGRIAAGVATHFDITARKRGEEALRESEARYRSLVEMSPDAIVVHADGHYIYANAAAARLFGAADPDDLIGQAVMDLIHPDYQDFTAKRLKQAQSGRSTDLRENRILTLDGRSVDIEVTGTGITYQGKPAIQSVMRDISARKQAEAERERLLTERDRTATQLEAVLNSMSEGLIISDLEGNILAMNQAALALRRFESVEEVRRHISEFPKIMEVRELSGELLPVEEWPMARALRGETFSDWELRVRRRDLEEEFICSYSGAPVLDKSGQAILAIVSMRDITARKRAEVALRESEERYRSLFDSNHAVMLLVNPETGAIVDANPAACGYYGHSQEELIAKKITDLNTLTPEQVFAEMQKAKELQQRQFHFRHRLASGEERDVEVFSGPIRVKGRDLLYSIILISRRARRLRRPCGRAKPGCRRFLKTSTKVWCSPISKASCFNGTRQPWPCMVLPAWQNADANCRSSPTPLNCQRRRTASCPWKSGLWPASCAVKPYMTGRWASGEKATAGSASSAMEARWRAIGTAGRFWRWSASPTSPNANRPRRPCGKAAQI